MAKPEKAELPDDAAQSERFLLVAKELEADKNEAAFKAALRVITTPASGPKTSAEKKPKE